MSKEQIFHDSLLVFRDKIALAISIDFKDAYGPTWMDCHEVNNARPLGFEKSKRNDLKTWDLTQLIALLWSKHMRFNSQKFGKNSHLTFLKVIKAYRNEWAHQQPLDIFEIYRAIDLMILALGLLGHQSEELEKNRISLAKEIAKLDSKVEGEKEYIKKKENKNKDKLDEEKKNEKENKGKADEENKGSQPGPQENLEESKIGIKNEDSIQTTQKEAKNPDDMDIELPNIRKVNKEGDERAALSVEQPEMNVEKEFSKDGNVNPIQIPNNLLVNTTNFPRMSDQKEDSKKASNQFAKASFQNPNDKIQVSKKSESIDQPSINLPNDSLLLAGINDPAPNDNIQAQLQRKLHIPPQENIAKPNSNLYKNEYDTSLQAEEKQTNTNNLPRYYSDKFTSSYSSSQGLAADNSKLNAANAQQNPPFPQPLKLDNPKPNFFAGNAQENLINPQPPKLDNPRPILYPESNQMNSLNSQKGNEVVNDISRVNSQNRPNIPIFNPCPQNPVSNQPQFIQNQFPIYQNPSQKLPSSSYASVPYEFQSQAQQRPNLSSPPSYPPMVNLQSSYQNLPQNISHNRPNIPFQPTSYELPSQSLQIPSYYSQPPLTPLQNTKNPYLNPSQNVSQSINIDSYLPKCIVCRSIISDELYFEHSSQCQKNICWNCISKFASKAKQQLNICPFCKGSLSNSEIDYLDYIASEKKK